MEFVMFSIRTASAWKPRAKPSHSGWDHDGNDDLGLSSKTWINTEVWDV